MTKESGLDIARIGRSSSKLIMGKQISGGSKMATAAALLKPKEERIFDHHILANQFGALEWYTSLRSW
eukprot:CAMPEP_0194070536 /NCGR_PEP_ID=MMETSP0009_2-20130614/88233_1 /TAXON_ID=210454 /ORGANISM="Grammatophora oceanica, Strain CCMP 410" /LENGTH=67 /DNA_ID=CAMNT_0038723815 /DNA_START=3731 /DNA_END=3931 /DNA_ORIENTATION=+